MRNRHYSNRQWEKAGFCSGRCSGKHRMGILWGKEEYRLKMSVAHKGYAMPEAQKAKISLANSFPRPWRRGDKSPNWKGGITLDPKSYSWLKNQYKARKKKAEGIHTLKEWATVKQKYNFTCVWCKKSEPEIKLTEDHIIPLSKGGSNYIENIQPLCGLCNSKKGARILKNVSNFYEKQEEKRF